MVAVSRLRMTGNLFHTWPPQANTMVSVPSQATHDVHLIYASRVGKGRCWTSACCHTHVAASPYHASERSNIDVGQRDSQSVGLAITCARGCGRRRVSCCQLTTLCGAKM